MNQDFSAFSSPENDDDDAGGIEIEAYDNHKNESYNLQNLQTSSTLGYIGFSLIKHQWVILCRSVQIFAGTFNW